MRAAVVLVWLLTSVQVVTTTGCAVLLTRRHQPDARHLARSIHRCAPVLAAAAVLPLPALLVADAPAAAWGLWGALTITAALIYARADALRDVLPTERRLPLGASGDRPKPDAGR
ncbi:hypothetical protein [Streptomyces sp. NRRL F-4474]|uniref:hypothetical protein n=1 Tax=Streptomyces sp. NRRL F-4474 TaxID=1463851 RepID=UPI0004C4E033|nr:hypothetical protein [Streptomyces sp. NRRL F-4474]